MRNTSRLTGSIDREVRTLVTTLDECTARLMGVYPDAGMTIRKVPDRLVLQAGNVGVTVSLFRSRAGMEASVEVIIAVWQGEVTMPGSSPRGGHRAKQLSAQQFRIMACGETEWLWSDEATTTTMTSRDLAAACIETMAEHLRSGLLYYQKGASPAHQ
jgi:hypothetical protein